MKQFESVTYFLPLATGEVEHLYHPENSERIIHSVPQVKRQPVAAIVVGVHEELLDLIFVHPQRIPTLSSGDWYNALERAYGVRPEGHPDLADGDERLGYYEDDAHFIATALRATKDSILEKHEETIEQLRCEVSALQAELSQTTEGKDAALQAIADARARTPSSADLDAVADEDKAKEATKGNGKKAKPVAIGK